MTTIQALADKWAAQSDHYQQAAEHYDKTIKGTRKAMANEQYADWLRRQSAIYAKFAANLQTAIDSHQEGRGL